MKKRPLATICVLVIAIQILMMAAREEEKSSFLDKPSNLSAVGQVYRRERQQEYQILYLRDAEVSAQNKKTVQFDIIVYDKEFQKVRLGNTVFVTGEGTSFDVPKNPGNYDQRFYYEKQGIALMVFAEKIKILEHTEWRIREFLVNLRLTWHRMLLQVLGEKNGGILSAMITGEKESLTQESRELYQSNGIGHILAISGLHLSFIGLALYQGIRKLGISYQGAGIMGGVVLILYAVMTGMSVSAERAMWMFLIRIGADMCGRVYDMVTALLISACILLIRSPLYMLDAGFLLSYGAIAGICVLLPVVRELGGGNKCGIRTSIMDGIYASASIQIFLFPITLYFFFEIPPYAVFLNILVIPSMSLVLGVGLLGSLIYGILPWLGEAMLKSVSLLFTAYDFLCQETAKLPFARIVFGKPKWQQVVLCYVFMMVFSVYIEKKVQKDKKTCSKWGKCVGLLTLCCFLALSIPWHGIEGNVRVTMLDVGQGDGIYIKGPSGMHYMIDGGSSDVKEVGKYRIEPFLKSQGVGTLDYVLLSHGDADHVNGIREMLKRQKVGIRIRAVVLPVQEVWDETLRELAETAVEQGTRVLTITEAQNMQEELCITCLQPGTKSGLEAGNEASMVLQMKYKDFDMLFTGDTEGKGEELLRNNKSLVRTDVLKAAHHGSKNSTTEELLQKLQPKLALISAGIENSYGHPHQETIERLQKYDVKIYSTQESGAVTVSTDGKKIWIEEFIK